MQLLFPTGTWITSITINHLITISNTKRFKELHQTTKHTNQQRRKSFSLKKGSLSITSGGGSGGIEKMTDIESTGGERIKKFMGNKSTRISRNFNSTGKKRYQRRPMNKDSLDNELENYMMNDVEVGKSILDNDLAAYMQEIGTGEMKDD